MTDWLQVALPVVLATSFIWSTVLVVMVSRAFHDGHCKGQENGLVHGYKQGYGDGYRKARPG